MLDDWDDYAPATPDSAEMQQAYNWLLDRGGVASSIDFEQEFYHTTFEDLRAEGLATTTTFEGDGKLYYSILGN